MSEFCRNPTNAGHIVPDDYDCLMDERQIHKTIRTLEGELSKVELQRDTLEEALLSLRRLLPPDDSAAVKKQDAILIPESNGRYPGTTPAILLVIDEGKGRPVPTGRIRETFDQRGWLKTPDGRDRSKTIYETLRRLTKEGRLRRLGKDGYVVTESARKG